MRRTSKPAITPAMYRHFAVLTLAVTGVLAFFAEGESRQTLAEEVDQRQQASHEKHDPPKLARREAPPQAGAGSWGSDEGRRFGQPTMSASRSGVLARTASTWGPELAQHGNDYLSRLSQEDRDALLQELATNAGGSPSEMREQIASAEAASRLRSGSADRMNQ